MIQTARSISARQNYVTYDSNGQVNFSALKFRISPRQN